VAEVALAAGSVGQFVHDCSPTTRYWTRKPVSSEELSAQDRSTLVALETVTFNPLGAAGTLVETVSGSLRAVPWALVAPTRNV